MKSYEKYVEGVGKVEFVEFDSLHDFKNYIMNTPINEVFTRSGKRSSITETLKPLPSTFIFVFATTTGKCDLRTKNLKVFG